MQNICSSWADQVKKNSSLKIIEWQVSSETKNIFREDQIISENFIYDMLVDLYVVPPRHSNRKFTVQRKPCRADLRKEYTNNLNNYLYIMVFC